MGFPVLPKKVGVTPTFCDIAICSVSLQIRSHHAQLLRYVGQLKAPAMVQMRAPRRGGVTGRTQMATKALALAMALAVDDLADRDGPLARVLRASENREAPHEGDSLRQHMGVGFGARRLSRSCFRPRRLAGPGYLPPVVSRELDPKGLVLG